jgi:hypothetical protein
LFSLLGLLALTAWPGASQAKGNGEQAQIILLNDSAAALEDTDPALSQRLVKFADEKEKEWIAGNARKDAVPIVPETSGRRRQRIELLNEAAGALQPVYPLIAKGLKNMAKDLGRETANKAKP